MLDRRDKRSLLGELELAGAKIKSDGREIFCAFHEDKHPSGGVYQREDGSWAYKCHANSCGFCGDVFDVVSRASGRPLADVLKENSPNRPVPATKKPLKVYESLEAIEASIPGTLEARYSYTNPETRQPDLVVLRFVQDGKKHFWQVSPHGSGFVLQRPSGLLPLYNRIEVSTAGKIILVEGEKCVHALRFCGQVGTTSPMGAGKASYADWGPLAGKVAYLWPDNDDAGVKHMQEVAEILEHLEPPTPVYWIDPKGLNLPVKGDVADFVAGMDREQAHSAVAAVIESAVPLGAASELRDMLEETIRGKRIAVSWPWELLGLQSKALLPGTVTLFCGEPGASKSYALLQAFRHWHQAGVRAVIFELEEDRAYHMNRLLAQECGNADLLDPDWIRTHADDARAAMQTHSGLLNDMGRKIYAAPREQVDYRSLVTWAEARASEGARIVCIDPVTAVAPVRDVWVADSDFIFRIKTIAREHGCSIVLVTHPRKGRGSTCGMDDLAGGAAFQRFSQTLLWLESMKHLKKFTVRSACGRWPMDCNRVLHMMKCRNGRGTGCRIGMMWSGETLMLAEQGIIIEESKKSHREPGQEG